MRQGSTVRTLSVSLATTVAATVDTVAKGGGGGGDKGRYSLALQQLLRSELGLAIVPAFLSGCLWATAGDESSNANISVWRPLLLFGPFGATAILAGWLV